LIVVDASAVVEAMSGDEQTRSLLVENNIAAPHLLDTEVIHVIRKHLQRRAISLRVANEAVSFLHAFEIERVATVALNDAIWGMRANLTSYDATYVALAQHLDVPLLTGDRRMAKAARRYCQTIVID
jgi:predicted nucleic acid-binding protein